MQLVEGSAGEYGRIYALSGKPIIEIRESLDDGAKCMTLGHELGHYMLHWPQIQAGYRPDDDLHQKGLEDEALADLVGSILMMTDRDLATVLGLASVTLENGCPLNPTLYLWRVLRRTIWPETGENSWAELPRLEAEARSYLMMRPEELRQAPLAGRFYVACAIRMRELAEEPA